MRGEKIVARKPLSSQKTINMSYTSILTNLENGIFTITINRPDKMNALNNAVIEELGQAIDEVYNNNDIRSAIITGAGEKSFVAGADISQFLGLSSTEGKELAKKGSDIFFRIENCPKPVIACVNGFALGGGCELAMACHFRYASESAKFGQPEINLGLLPGYGGTQRLVHLIGRGRAMELLMTGNMIDAATGLHYGLVNRIFKKEELLEKAIATLQLINSKSPLALTKIISTVNAVWDKQSNGFELELNAFGESFNTEDMKEGATAFLEKRKPVFKGK